MSIKLSVLALGITLAYGATVAWTDNNANIYLIASNYFGTAT